MKGQGFGFAKGISEVVVSERGVIRRFDRHDFSAPLRGISRRFSVRSTQRDLYEYHDCDEVIFAAVFEVFLTLSSYKCVHLKRKAQTGKTRSKRRKLPQEREMASGMPPTDLTNIMPYLVSLPCIWRCMVFR